MKKTVNNLEQTEQVESAPFVLELPKEINVEPWHTVLLPRNKQAMIYEVTYINEKTMASAKRFDAYIVSRKTLKQNNDHYHYGRLTHFDDMAALKHYLYSVAAELSVKKRTRKVVDVQDLQETDDDE
jgi:antibiotic biosynthesis monooxygenase (ABM) superfamily enzyme